MCFFLLDTRRKYLFGWQELLWKIHSTPKIYSSPPPPPLLIYVSYILRLLRLIWQKNFIRKYEGLCEKKLTFSKLATPEVQVPVWLIDAYWNGNKNFQLKKVKFSKSMARPPRGWVERVLIGDIFFWMVFFPLHWGEKNWKKKEKNVFFSQCKIFLGQKIATSMEIKILEINDFLE